MRTVRQQHFARYSGGSLLRRSIVAMTVSLALSSAALAAPPDPVAPAPVSAAPAPSPPADAPAPAWPAQAPVAPDAGSTSASAAPGLAVDPWNGRPGPTATQQPGPRPMVEVTTSYGWQIVLADVAGLAAIGVVGAAGGGGASVAPYFLASPIVHGVHGNTGKAFGSLGLHLGLPLVGMLVGVGVSGQSCESDACGLPGLVLGLLGGMVAATVVDAAWLAHTTVEVDASQVALAPTVTVARSGGATFGVAATF